MQNSDVPQPFRAIQHGAVRIKFAHEGQWQGMGLLNPNEYEGTARPLANEAATAMGRVYVLSELLSEAVVTRRARGFAEPIAQIPSVIPMEMVAEFESQRIMLLFDTFLMATVAVLDSVVRLLRVRISNLPDGFRGSRDQPGREVLRALKGSGQLPSTSELGAVIEEHKSKWLDDLVLLRHDSVHHGAPTRAIGFWARLEVGAISKPRAETIGDPVVMRLDGSSVSLLDYVRFSQAGLSDLIVSLRDLTYPALEREATLANNTP